MSSANYTKNPLALSVFRNGVEKNVSNGCGFKNDWAKKVLIYNVLDRIHASNLVKSGIQCFVASALLLLVNVRADGLQAQTVKLRIGNPYDQGVFVARMSSLNPRQVLSLEYLPPKGSRYFNGSLDVYVLPTDLVGVWPTQLNEKASDDAINLVRGQAVQAFAQGEFVIWRIEQIKQGLTKVFLTLKELDKHTIALVPNGPIQDGAVPEITFARWYSGE